MSKLQSFVFRCLISGLLIVVCHLINHAQSTILNIPSTDVLPKKTFYAEGDFISHIDSFRNGGFQTYGYRTVYGVTKNLEVGLNLFYTRSGATNPTEFQPNFKLKVYANERFGISATTGLLVARPLNRTVGSRTTGLFYSNVSKIVKHTNGLRVTGGVYTVVGADRNFGTKDGIIVGIEQPITGKLQFLSDWYSGKNRYGYSTAGFGYTITKKQSLFLNYNFGNSGRGNNAISGYYGVTF